MTTRNSEVIVIGGGVAGCSTAFFLAQEGVKCTVVEQESVGSHASGFAFGGLNPLDGTGTPYPLLDFSVHCFQTHKKLAPELLELSGVDNQFYQRDRLSLAFDDADVARITEHLEVQQRVSDFDVKWIEAEDVFRLEPDISPDCVGAVLTQGSGAVEGYRHTLAMAQAAEKLGTAIVHGRVTGVARSGDGVAVAVGNSTLEADVAVLALGPWCQEAEAWTGAAIPVVPFKGQILRLQLENKELQTTLSWGKSYAASKPDGLLWAGTTEEHSGFDDQPTPQGRDSVMGDLLRMASFLSEAQLVQHTACLRPLTPDGLPIVGRVPGWDNVYLCTGAGRKGILWSTGMGRATADLILRGQSDVPGLEHLRPERFAPGDSR